MRLRTFYSFIITASTVFLTQSDVWSHGSAVSPASRVYRVYASNPENPSFALADEAVELDGTLSYYTWTELSRNIPDAVVAGLPVGFDYSPWVPNGQLASGGRVDPNSTEYPRTYAGLDQVSADWPTSPAQAGAILPIVFDAHTPHDPSVWDVWLTTANWTPTIELNWQQMEFLGRPLVTLTGGHYYFDVPIPSNRVGHHVLWIAWHRDDPVGEVFFSTSDLMIAPAAPNPNGDYNYDGFVNAADYTVWRDRLGTMFTQSHYGTWRANFGQSFGSGGVAVPEPRSWVLVGMIVTGASIISRLNRAVSRDA